MKKLLLNEKGASMLEYGLLGALISVVALVAISSAGRNVDNSFAITACVACLNRTTVPNPSNVVICKQHADDPLMRSFLASCRNS